MNHRDLQVFSPSLLIRSPFWLFSTNDIKYVIQLVHINFHAPRVVSQPFDLDLDVADVRSLVVKTTRQTGCDAVKRLGSPRGIPHKKHWHLPPRSLKIKFCVVILHIRVAHEEDEWGEGLLSSALLYEYFLTEYVCRSFQICSFVNCDFDCNAIKCTRYTRRFNA